MERDRKIFVGAVKLFSFPNKLHPKEWLECNGSILKIEKYVVLYSLIGIQFGGDGRNTFALPGPSNLPTVPPGSEAKNKYYICIEGGFPNWQ
ncbi:MAG: tail fiber protein [Saprospiraceae bacterium]|nr:tail fiber protein [Saprospiraceae bacterium]